SARSTDASPSWGSRRREKSKAPRAAARNVDGRLTINTDLINLSLPSQCTPALGSRTLNDALSPKPRPMGCRLVRRAHAHGVHADGVHADGIGGGSATVAGRARFLREDHPACSCRPLLRVPWCG